MASKRKSSISSRSIDRHMLAMLKNSQLNKQQLNELVKIASKVQLKTKRPLRAFPDGIPNPDGLGIETVLDKQAAKSFVDTIINTERVVNIEWFPLGIPWPELFRVKVGFR